MDSTLWQMVPFGKKIMNQIGITFFFMLVILN